jgi:glycosyltransferase involved in cell wall biosynthesis
MRILFIHNNFPAQYRRIMTYLADRPKLGVEMYAATLDTNNQSTAVKKTVKFKPHREPRSDIHPSVTYTERSVIMGQALYGALMGSKKAGFKPDIILSHSGWGSSLFMKDLFPDAKLLSYFEWYYHSLNSDGLFLRDEPYDPNEQMRIRMKNTPILHDLAAMDHGQSPTAFQRSKMPAIFQSNITQLHDGVDTKFFKPNPRARVKIGDHTFTVEDEVITYVARGMEEYRGFPQFMEAVYKLQQIRPNLQVVILGNDRVAYGNKRSDGKSFKEAMLEKYDFDMSRLHFMGLQPLKVFAQLMQITRAHVYLTVPFVLSWSMLEAMSAGALIVGSDTEPVRELITDGDNGVLVPFFDVDATVDKVCHIIDNKEEYEEMRKAARQTIVDNYAVKDLLPKYWDLIKSVANGSHI